MGCGFSSDQGPTVELDEPERGSATQEYSPGERRGSMEQLHGVLLMKLAEGTVHEDDDTDEWALLRLSTLSRLTPLRLVRHVVNQVVANTEGVAVHPQSFFDRASCAVLFLDYSCLSAVSGELFKRHGLEDVQVLASTLNTYLGRIVDRLTQCGGDVIKFAGDAVLVVFMVTDEADLAHQTLKASQLSLECIAELQAGRSVEGVTLTAHSGIGVGEITGFMVGGVFNRSEYTVVGEPVYQAASANPVAEESQTVISAEGWALIESRAEGQQTEDGHWIVKAVKAADSLSDTSLASGGDMADELARLSRSDMNRTANEIKRVVPGAVRNRLPEFTPTSIPCISEFRFVTILYARVVGLDYSRGDEELKKVQTIVKLIQETIYVHDGNFMRFSMDDRGAVVMGIYGLPPSHENDPERGVRAGLDICRQVEERQEEFGGARASVGLSSGYCWLGLVGGVSRCEYTTQGPLMGVAARLMCASERGVMVDLGTKNACERSTKKFAFAPKPATVLDDGEMIMPGLLRTGGSSREQAQATLRANRAASNTTALLSGGQSTKNEECFMASRPAEIVVSTSPVKKPKVLKMKISEETVDAEHDTQEWAVKRLEVLSRLAPYRLLRHVIAQQDESARPALMKAGLDHDEVTQLSHGTLWVANIHDDVVAKGVPFAEAQLAEAFGGFGTVDSVTVREKRGDATSMRAEHQSWALVTFNLDGGALADLEGAVAQPPKLAGLKLIVKKSRADKELRKEGTGALGSIVDDQSHKSKSLSSEVDQQNFFDRASCAAMFIDISGFSKITEILFKKHGLQGVEVLASTLNTYLGRIVDRLTQCGGDVIKFAGDAALVIFAVTPEADLARQALKATQLSLECISDLESGEAVVEGVVLTAHTGIGVGDVTGFLVGGVFNRSEYAIIGDPVFQIASAEPAAGNGETVISPEAWALIEEHAEGRPTTDNNWLVTSIKKGHKLDDEALGHGGGIVKELAMLTKDAANLAAGEIKQVVPGGVRNRLPDFTPTSMPSISEFRLVTMLFARLQGLDYSRGDKELKKIQTLVKLIQQTIYTHDGIFLRFSVDDKGAVVMGVYGLPPSHTNDSERAVMASLDFCRQIHTRCEEFGGVKASVGLTTGYCWLGLVGGVSRCEYTAHAPMINLAARLMCASDDSVMVDQATKDACERTNLRAKFDAKPAIRAKGFADPVPIFVPRLAATPGIALKHWAGMIGHDTT